MDKEYKSRAIGIDDFVVDPEEVKKFFARNQGPAHWYQMVNGKLYLFTRYEGVTTKACVEE